MTCTVLTLLVSFHGQVGLLARFREVLGTSQLVRLENQLAMLCDPFKPAKIFYLFFYPGSRKFILLDS